jgi:lysophospholipase L1-like esterase
MLGLVARRTLTLGLAVITAAAAEPACPDVAVPALRLPATSAAVARNAPVVIVAFGSSSTEGEGASAPTRTYPALLGEHLRTAWPGVTVSVLNRGKGGETTADMLERLNRDVIDSQPTLVIWQNGGHAALRDLDPDDFGTLTRRGIGAIQGVGADLVLMDNQVAPRIERAPRHAVYGEILAREAATSGASLFSRTALMRAWALVEPVGAEPGGSAMIGPDGLHHTDRGYACLAAAVGRAIVAAVPR